MPSTREVFGLVTFASRIPATFVRKGMRSYLLSIVDPAGERKQAGEEFVTALARLKRIPDAVAILDESASAGIGLPSAKHILFVEVEYSAPITESALTDYAELFDNADDPEYSMALVVVDHYGAHRVVNLGGILVACAVLNTGGLSKPSIDAHEIRATLGV